MLLLGIFAFLMQTPNFDAYLSAQRAYAANPRSEDRMVSLVSILFESDRNDRAIAALEPFVKANPRASRARLFLALGYARTEKYAQAKALASQVATETPNDYYAQHILGLSLFGLNEFDAAEARFKKSIALKADFADSYFQLGLLYARKPQMLEQAQQAYERAATLGYKHAEIYRNLGSVSIKQGKYDDAVQYLHQALNVNPDYADAYFQLADALRKSGKAEQAAEASQKFQALNAAALDKKQRDTQGQAFYEQGMNLLQKDDLANAYQAFRKAADAIPRLDAAYYRLAQLDYLRDDNRQATSNIRQALELNPFEAEYYFVLARCIEGSDKTAAIDAVTRAIALNSRVGDFHNLLGDLYVKISDYTHAVESYRHAVDLEPKNTEYRNNLAAAQRKLPDRNE
jgi:tetratricopeptide (TPR) repeat protein